VTGCKKIDGVIDVTVTAYENQLKVRFDRRVTTRARVTAAVQKVVDSIEQ
jgi:hypothetical protein